MGPKKCASCRHTGLSPFAYPCYACLAGSRWEPVFGNPTYPVTPTTHNCPKLVALYSPAMGSGKSEVAKIMAENFGYSVVKFAGGFKEMLRALYAYMGLPDADSERMIEGDLKTTAVPGLGPLTTRGLMQTLGTEWGRHQLPDLWVRIAMSRVALLHSQGKYVVIDDLRFPNELEAVKDAGGLCLCVVRPGVEATTSHPSEGLLSDRLDQFDGLVANKGSLADLSSSVQKLILSLGDITTKEHVNA